MSTGDPTTVELGQTLHGYANGHRLLAGSVSLPREAERLLLVLSDVSGPGLTDEFDGYLTGYSLPGGVGYALARTWLAREMPRPGCVWTHTLIIPNPELDQVVESAALLDAFRRPSLPGAYADYQSPVHLPVRKRLTEPTPMQPSDAAAVLRALYDEPFRPVVVAADRAAQFEPLLVHLWNQQWSSLRKVFSFCTGSLAGRTLDSRPFDLQVMPWAEARRMSKVRPAPVIISDRAVPDDQPWTNVATDDLIGTQDQVLGMSLRTAGQYLPGDRAYFKPLVRLLSLNSELPDRERARSVLSVLADTFPTAPAGLPLKRLVFTTTEVRVDAFDLIGEVALVDDPLPFAELGPVIASSAERLWSDDVTRLERAVCDAAIRSPGPTRDPFLDGVSRALKPNDLVRLGEVCPESLSALVPRVPQLLLSPDAWRGSSSYASRLIERVKSDVETFTPHTSALIRAAMDAAAQDLAEPLIEVLGSETITAALDWTSDRRLPLPDGWPDAVAKRSAVAIRWLAEREVVPAKSLSILTELLNPWSDAVRAAGVEPWVKHAEVVRDGEITDRYRVLAFLLVVGLLDSSENSFPLVAVAFTDFYRAARDIRLPDANWDLVAGVLPSQDWWWSWDRCARMRQGVAERFVAGCWSPSRLFELTDDSNVFGELFGTFRSYKDGKRFIRLTAEALRTGTIQGVTWQTQFFDGW